MIKAILAINNHRYIGKDNKLMWQSSEDFKHFKTLTMGSILIVGRKTFEGDLKGKGLPGRECIVIGKDYYSIEEAIFKATELYKNDGRNIFVIGGASIYEALKDRIDEWHISIIDDNQIGDLKFELTQEVKDKAKFYYFKTN